MRDQGLSPIIRDIVFLGVGTGIFSWEALHQARLVPMLMAMLMALGPGFVAAYWSARTKVNGSLRQQVSSWPSSSSSPSSLGEAHELVDPSPDQVA